MKVIDFNRQSAKIQFSIDELTILKNILFEASQNLDLCDIQKRINDIDKDEVDRLLKIIEIVYPYRFYPDSTILHNENLVRLTQITEEGIIFNLTYRALIGFRGYINELCHGMYAIKEADFQSRISFEKFRAVSLLDSINMDVVKKMEEGTPSFLIFHRWIEIKNYHLNFSEKQTKDLPFDLNVRRKCILKLNSNYLMFYIKGVSPKKHPTMLYHGGLLIAVSSDLEQYRLYIKSRGQAIKYDRLIHLVAYLELVITSKLNKADLEEYIWTIGTPQQTPLFKLQVIPKEFGDREEMKINFKLLPNNQEEIGKGELLEIEDTASVSDIKLFISSICSFICELVSSVSDRHSKYGGFNEV
ncbi:hypothetical protein IQ235_11635 [Oscillatoriales cyanobacterium LEGE 11467]|uniref:Uncharacterized protein n=1 Tax=Zarconia navalis LEGE 11467 TaxID=1828826 RepID=A0A928VZ07_9CYAN|nr:hypothetical protein [Zarconia navalis]MBE9041432.1 hypothetical protein [Zarconia navalis LEGE 11467]